jgi:MYXO-CTERM domain-containing protein
VCIGGKPELSFSPDPAELVDSLHDVDVAIKHTGSGAAITLTGATIDPAGTFSIVTGPQFPVAVAAGAEVHFTLRLAADATPGDHSATLNVHATSCADQPVQLHAKVDSPSTGGGSDGGTPADAGTGSLGPASANSTQAASGGGCSSGGAPTGMLGLVALAMLAVRRRRRA